MILSLALLLFPAVRCQDNTAIDFSGGEVDLETGVVCVELEEERDVVEQDSEQQCTQQIVRKRDFSRCTHSYLIYAIIANTEICSIYLNVPSLVSVTRVTIHNTEILSGKYPIQSASDCLRSTHWPTAADWSIFREECEDVFTKTCKIVMRQQSYNHTARVCKRPLEKECFEPV